MMKARFPPDQYMKYNGASGRETCCAGVRGRAREEEFPSLSIIHVVPKASGGGAELLVRELAARQNIGAVQAQAVYYHRSSRDRLLHFEQCLNLARSRSPHAVSRLREVINGVLASTDARTTVVVHLHLTWGLLYGVLACQGLPVKVLYTEHSTSNKYRKIRGSRYFFGEFYRRLNRVVCISEGVERSLTDWLPSRGKATPRVIVTNGARLMAPPATPRPNPSKRGLRVVAVGSLSWRKGFDILLSALAEGKHFIASAVIVGEGPEHKNLLKVVERLNLEGICKFVGWQRDVEPWFHQADCLVMSSRWEGFGLVAVEAMSTGLPVVAPRLLGLSEVLAGSRAGFLYEPQSATDLLAELSRVHDSLASGDVFEADAVERASHFSLDKMAGEYVRVYQELAN